MAAGPAGLGAPWPGLPRSVSEVKGVKGVQAGRGGGQQHPRGAYFQTRLFLMRWVYFAKTLLGLFLVVSVNRRIVKNKNKSNKKVCSPFSPKSLAKALRGCWAPLKPKLR